MKYIPKTCTCLMYRVLYTNQAIQNQPKHNSCDVISEPVRVITGGGS